MPRLALERQIEGPASPCPQTPTHLGWEGHPTCPAVSLLAIFVLLGGAEAQPWRCRQARPPRTYPAKGAAFQCSRGPERVGGGCPDLLCTTSRVPGAKCGFPGSHLPGQPFSPSCSALHVPLPCLRPGDFQSTTSSGRTGHVVCGSPYGPYSRDWPWC